MFGIDDIISTGLKIIDKVIPDPAQKDAAKLALLQLQQSGELAELEANVKLATAQTDTNKTEAANASIFVSGWRPFIGWTCGIGLSVQFLVGPLLTYAADLYGHPLAFPQLDTGTLMTLLVGMLGLGGYRTFEKINGVTVGRK